MSMQHRIHITFQALIALGLGACFGASSVSAGDWNTVPSTYSHDLQTGRRTNQFQEPKPAYYPAEPQVIRSGYRQVRGSIQVGGLSDNHHRVERWGEQVRPYGEWRFPYRPYSAPYPAWGPPPFTGFNAPYSGGPFAGGGFVGRGFGGRFAPGGPPVAGGPAGGGRPGAGLIAPPGIDPRRIPVPAQPDRWRPWHDGGYPETPRDYYQRAPEPYWPTR